MSFVTKTARAAQCIARIFTSTGNGTPEGRALAYMLAEPDPSTGAATQTAGTGSSPSSAEVVVDWRMTPEEWEELRGVLLTRPWSPYIERLWRDGELGPVPGVLMAGTYHSEIERCEALESIIKSKEVQVADLQLQLRDCHLELRAARERQNGELWHNGKRISLPSRLL